MENGSLHTLIGLYMNSGDSFVQQVMAKVSSNLYGIFRPCRKERVLICRH